MRAKEALQQMSHCYYLWWMSERILPKMQGIQSDDGKDAWRIIWKNGLAICERCGSVIDLWVNGNDLPKQRKDEKVA